MYPGERPLGSGALELGGLEGPGRPLALVEHEAVGHGVGELPVEEDEGALAVPGRVAHERLDEHVPRFREPFDGALGRLVGAGSADLE
jgi:hypothetical protein